MRFACTDFAFRSKLLHAQSCTNPRIYSLRSLIRGFGSLKPNKKPILANRLLVWLGKMDGNGTFYSSEYDPQFNIEDIREILDKDEEVDNT